MDADADAVVRQAGAIGHQPPQRGDARTDLESRSLVEMALNRYLLFMHISAKTSE
jgi:hypothetical protein